MLHRRKLLIVIIAVMALVAVVCLLPLPKRFTFQGPAMRIVASASIDSGNDSGVVGSAQSNASDGRSEGSGSADIDGFDQAPVTMEITGWRLCRLLHTDQIHATVTVRDGAGTVLRTIRLENTSTSLTSSNYIDDLLVQSYWYIPNGKSSSEGRSGILVFDTNGGNLMLSTHVTDRDDSTDVMEFYVAPASTSQQANEVRSAIERSFCFYELGCMD